MRRPDSRGSMELEASQMSHHEKGMKKDDKKMGDKKPAPKK